MKANPSIEELFHIGRSSFVVIFSLTNLFVDSIKFTSTDFNSSKKEYNITVSGNRYNPVLDVYLNVIIGDNLLVPFIDYAVVTEGSNTVLKLKNAPPSDARSYIASIEAPISSFGSGATAVGQIGATGNLSGIKVKNGGCNYRIEYPP